MNKDVLVIAEHINGEIKPVSLELISFGRRLAEITGGNVTAAVLGYPVIDIADRIARLSGADVLAVENEALATYNAEAYKIILKEIIEKRVFGYVMIPHTSCGWDFAPALAVSLDATCITGVLDIDERDELGFSRQILNGKLQATIKPAAGRRVLMTISGGAAAVDEETSATPGTVEAIFIDKKELRTFSIGYTQPEKKGIDLSKADIIISAGRGVGSAEGIEIIAETAALFSRGAVGASRSVCDAGWLPVEHLVGITGQSVAPKLYLACGISGAIQHTSAISNARIIAAVNKDPESLIFNVSHICIVADLHQFLPVLIEKLKDASN